MGQPQKDRIDISDYVTIEQEDHLRYEYHDGQLFAMAGGSIPHSTICNNIATALHIAARKKGTCQPFNSEMKLEVRPKRKYVYADAGIAGPKLNPSENITGAITNPTVVVEVISDTSAKYDFESKRKWYFSLPSVKEYVLISQDEVAITVFRRRGELFKVDSYDSLEGELHLESLEAGIPLAEIYLFTELV